MTTPDATPIAVHPVQVVDLALRGVGGLLVLFWSVRHFQARRLAAPLGPNTRLTGPPPAVFVAALLGYILLAQLVTSVVFLGAEGGANAAIQAAREEPGSSEWRMLSLADQIARLVLVGFVLIFAGRELRLPGKACRSAPRWAAAAVGLTLAALFVCTLQLVLTNWVWESLFTSQPAPQHPALLAFRNGVWGVWGQALIVLGAVVVAALFEEVVFRGLTLQGLAEIFGGRCWPPIILSSLLFAITHVSQPQTWLPLFTLGVLLAVTRIRYSLVMAIFVHALFNLRTIFLVLLVPPEFQFAY